MGSGSKGQRGKLETPKAIQSNVGHLACSFGRSGFPDPPQGGFQGVDGGEWRKSLRNCRKRVQRFRCELTNLSRSASCARTFGARSCQIPWPRGFSAFLQEGVPASLSRLDLPPRHGDLQVCFSKWLKAGSRSQRIAGDWSSPFPKTVEIGRYPGQFERDDSSRFGSLQVWPCLHNVLDEDH